ncbi:MAG: NFACT family protein [Lachnospiraceae bacterium]
MAFDGLVISNVVNECVNRFTNARIYKIYQPEKDELNLIIKNGKESYRLLLSASASLPLIYLTTEQKNNPLNAPNFCMLLRKHLNNGRIIGITQPGFERIIDFKIEHLDEMGDVCHKHLIVEIMGKHSNIIFCDDQFKIIDSIKHISAQISSVREVLPGRTYTFPPSQDKISPLEFTKKEFQEILMNKPLPTAKAIYSTITGYSPLIAEELCHRAHVDSGQPVQALDADSQERLFAQIDLLRLSIENHDYTPNIAFRDGVPLEFSSTPLTLYANDTIVEYDMVSEVLQNYYSAKNAATRIRQKSVDLRRIVTTALERSTKKYDLQLRQLKDTEKRDKYKVYGELINTYGYDCEPGAKALTCLNYYTNEEITIPLDPTLTPADNAKKYFNKYNKLKRTYEALSELVLETKAEMDHLQSVSTSLEIAQAENDLVEIKEELIQCGYIKRHFSGGKKKKEKITSKPLHYISSDGFDMYVGKNNLQNDYLSFKLANSGDWWFHAKNMPGSHVIVKLGTNKDMPDRTYEEAARLAAYYSSGRTAPKVEVDYTLRSNLRKPPAAKPGYVIYHTNYSMLIEPDISDLKEI